MTDNRDQTPEHLQIPAELADDPAAACEYLTARFFALTGDAEAAARAAQMATTAKTSPKRTAETADEARPQPAHEKPQPSAQQNTQDVVDADGQQLDDEECLNVHISECPLCHDDSPIIQLLRKRLQDACSEKVPDSLKMRIITHITAYTFIDYTENKD